MFKFFLKNAVLLSCFLATSFAMSVPVVFSEEEEAILNQSYKEADQDNIEYLAQNVMRKKSCEEVKEEIKERLQTGGMANELIADLLEMVLTIHLKQAVDMKALLKIDNPSAYKEEEFNMRFYEKEIKPWLCEHLMGGKTEEQIREEIRQAPTERRKITILGKAVHCGGIEDNFETYWEKPNIEG